MKGKETLAGPIIRISCNKEIKFQEAVTVQLPLSLRDTEQDAESLGISDLSLVRARVLFQPSSGTQKEWTEITDLLDSPPWLDGFVIKFNVKHFSGYVSASLYFFTFCLPHLSHSKWYLFTFFIYMHIWGN